MLSGVGKKRILIVAVSVLVIAAASLIGIPADAEEFISDYEIAASLSAPEVRTKSEPNGNVILTWKQVENADGYTVVRRKANGTKFTELWVGLEETAYTDDEAKPGTEYVYQVFPEYGEALGPGSNEAGAECYSVYIPTPYAAMYPGKKVKPKIDFAGVGKLSFRSKDEEIATVSGSGKITGKKQGMTTVTVSYGAYSEDIEVLVGGKAIDVSHWDYTINWDEVKREGVEAAIPKCTQGTTMIDATFEYNYKNACRVGMKVGAYCFSVAKSVKAAKAEARYILKVLHGRRLTYPIVMDFESNDVVNATTKKTRTKMVLAFKKVVEKAGYQFALYTSPSFIYDYFLYDQLEDVYLWLARYNGGKTYCEYTGPGKVMMWQWGGSRIRGVPVSVDTNYIYPGVYKG